MIVRQPGQGGAADPGTRDLRAELLAAEAAHFAKTREQHDESQGPTPAKRNLESSPLEAAGGNEDLEAKRIRILEETRDIDADSVGDESGTSDDESDEEDETAELMRELEKIKREKAEKKAKEVSFETVLRNYTQLTRSRKLSRRYGSRSNEKRASRWETLSSIRRHSMSDEGGMMMWSLKIRQEV